jgi:hypothetical protein
VSRESARSTCNIRSFRSLNYVRIYGNAWSMYCWDLVSTTVNPRTRRDNRSKGMYSYSPPVSGTAGSPSFRREKTFAPHYKLGGGRTVIKAQDRSRSSWVRKGMTPGEKGASTCLHPIGKHSSYRNKSLVHFRIFAESHDIYMLRGPIPFIVLLCHSDRLQLLIQKKSKVCPFWRDGISLSKQSRVDEDG